MSSILGPFYTLGLLIDNIILFLYTNFLSFIINVCLLVILCAVFISIINNSLFNFPEQPLILDKIIEQKEIPYQQPQKIELIKQHTVQEPSDEISYDMSLKYQNDYESNPLNPIYTTPKPGQNLIYTLGQSGFVLSTVVPENSTAIFENI